MFGMLARMAVRGLAQGARRTATRPYPIGDVRNWGIAGQNANAANLWKVWPNEWKRAQQSARLVCQQTPDADFDAAAKQHFRAYVERARKAQAAPAATLAVPTPWRRWEDVPETVRAVLRDRPKLEASIRAFIAKREAEDAAGTQQALRYDGLPAEIQERIRVMLAAEKGESAQASPTVLSD